MGIVETVVLCGTGGYGQTYVRELLRSSVAHGVRWVGAVDPYPGAVPNKADIDAAGVPWFSSLDEFYKNSGADLCIVASPIGFHAEQGILALRHGSHVLCEKPAAGIPADAAAMIDARDKAGKTLSIGFQWSYSDAMLRLKRDVAEGVYGKPLRLRTRALWPRGFSYYKRGGGWAGSQKDASGRWYLDSVASNATSHYLHNMLYILGGPRRSAMPDSMGAVLMRAYPIPMYDTAFMRMECSGTIISFIATHAGEEQDDVTCRFEFEGGVVTYDGNERGNARFVGALNGGAARDYGNPNAEEPNCAIWKLVASLRGESDAGFSCPIEAALPHSRAMIAALLSSRIGDFPEVRRDGDFLKVDGLNDLCRLCDAGLRLPGPDDAPWALPGTPVNFNDPRIDAYGTDLVK